MTSESSQRRRPVWRFVRPLALWSQTDSGVPWTLTALLSSKESFAVLPHVLVVFVPGLRNQGAIRMYLVE